MRSSEIRLTLKRGEEPLDWMDGFFEFETCEKPMDVQEFILDRTKWHRREALLKQAEVDAIRLRETNAIAERKSA